MQFKLSCQVDQPQIWIFYLFSQLVNGVETVDLKCRMDARTQMRMRGVCKQQQNQIGVRRMNVNICSTHRGEVYIAKK